MANELRGEVTVTLAGRAVTLRPSWTAVCETEDAWGCGWPEIVDRLQARRFRMRDMASLLLEGIKASGDTRYGEPSLKDVGALLIKHGALQDDLVDKLVTYVMGPLYDFDRAAQESGEAGKAKAETRPSA